MYAHVFSLAEVFLHALLVCVYVGVSLCWPQLKSAKCNAPLNGQYINVTLRNITINDPKVPTTTSSHHLHADPPSILTFE